MVDQCALAGISRSGWYYKPALQSAQNLLLMRLLDEQFTQWPFYGVRRMRAWLQRQGHQVNVKRVRRLLRLMGLHAIYPRGNRSASAPGHRIYPYLLRGMKIDRPNQVWASDITYIRLRQGFVYLVAIMDWFSRFVLSWELSTSLEPSFCRGALDWALTVNRPAIFNSDQGVQFTSEMMTSRLIETGVAISMDGRGRFVDNIFVERLWRSVKHEEVYLKDYRDVSEARENLAAYFNFYNRERLHQALNYLTPQEVYGDR